MENATNELLTGWKTLANELAHSLHLSVPPVSITFSDESPDSVPAFDEPMSSPSDDGRAGRVPASCVFWVKAIAATFTTSPKDHGNCSVGRYTHGLASFAEVADNADIAALLESGWVDGTDVGKIPAISKRANAISYGPLTDARFAPDVVLLRVNGRQLMVLSDAVPELRIEGKPQCHIVALAKEYNQVAASVGCALSRARTGMGPDEMTVAIPGSRLASVVQAVRQTAAVDTVVAKYAADDAKRFKVRQ
ncbi:DUF169 domain-containing protein [Ferrimicrobium acidiphilum]|jgi:uncharacterized protein (DUF169 family)|uniref:DUF169 domain-containing protein n=1 Tax=Ferrimicrobium acidiphilum TaxID=121039 RepID=UPI0023F340BD|nr:DUF169 domain-containing protein [Ferrimicrobium acidiphilum]MCL5052368.1 DUF169 domain-containing protein [Gammaproteobacteria bacterium]